MNLQGKSKNFGSADCTITPPGIRIYDSIEITVIMLPAMLSAPPNNLSVRLCCSRVPPVSPPPTKCAYAHYGTLFFFFYIFFGRPIGNISNVIGEHPEPPPPNYAPDCGPTSCPAKEKLLFNFFIGSMSY